MPCGDDNESKAGKAHDLAIVTGIQIPVTFPPTGKTLSHIFVDPFQPGRGCALYNPIELKAWLLLVHMWIVENKVWDC